MFGHSIAPQPGSTVLVAGCGGGFDVVCALPVALALRERGCRIHMASYAFSELPEIGNTRQHQKRLFEVTADFEPPPNGYCPEGWLARWWTEKFEQPLSVWSYHKVGIRPLADLYHYIRETAGIDAIVVCDAGVDALFYGNEPHLGTPEMDAATLLAAWHLQELPRWFVFTAFGSEGTGDRVRHADVLMRISEQVHQDSLLEVSALLRRCEPGSTFLEALKYIHAHTPRRFHSTMASSIQRAMEGAFGNLVLTEREGQLPTWISPLTLLYWFFDLDPLARAKPYFDQVIESDTLLDIHNAIDDLRDRVGVLPDSSIPI